MSWYIKKIFIFICVLSCVFIHCSKSFAIQEVKKNTVELKTQENIVIKEGDNLTLQDCINIALQNSPSIKMYKNLVVRANAIIGEAKSSYFPSLQAGTGYYGTFSRISGFGNTSSNSYELNASLSQLIYSFGKVGTLIKKAKLNKIAAEYDLNYETIKTIYDVKNAYFSVLAAVAFLKVQEATVLIDERNFQQTQAFFEEGLKSKIDVVNAEVLLSNAKISYVNAQNIYDLAVISLNNAMYIENAPSYSISKLESFNFDDNFAKIALKNIEQFSENFKVPELPKGATYTSTVKKYELINQDYNIKKFPLTLEEAEQHAREHRPDLKSYISARDALAQALKYQKIQLLPDLTANGGYSLRTIDTNSNTFNVSGALSFPIINLMRYKNQIIEAKADLNVANNQVEKLQKDIYFEVQAAYVSMVRLEKQIPLSEVEVRQSFENLELALGRYEVGLGNFLEVNTAINNYNKAQENYVKLIFDYNVARAKVELEIAQNEQVK